MDALFQNVMDTLAQNPLLAIGVAFVVAAAEALLVLGLFVPSTLVLVGIGGLIGLGKLPFWPLFLATALGAVVGDAMSFWIGHRYREHLYGIWPFSRYTSLLDGGKAYFRVHGGKSVVIGRFVPGVKAVVPSIAGMMGMEPWRFTVLNVLSAFVWAAAHLLPGLSAGLLMLGLGTVSKRLAVTLMVLLVATLLLVWVGNHLLALAVHQLPRVQGALARWGETYQGRGKGVVQRMVAAEHADFRLLVLLNLLVVTGIVSIAVLLESAGGQGMLSQFDHSFSQSVQALRTRWTDPLMLAVTLLGDAAVVVSVLLAMLLVLAWERRWQLGAGVALAFVTAAVFVNGMKWLVHTPRPVTDLYTGVSAYSFPSGHATVSFTLATLLGWFVWRGCRPWVKVLFLPSVGLLVVLVAFSRLYLGAHWPSDVLAGWLFGIGVVAVFAQIFRLESVGRRLAGRMLAATLGVLVLVGGWHFSQDWNNATTRYAYRPGQPLLLPRPWAAGGWTALPAYRRDWAGEHEEPFLLQWRGSPAQLQQALQDWIPAPDWSVQALNRFAAPDSSASQLPVLPKLHEGQPEQAAWVKPGMFAATDGRYVLRLYPQAVTGQGTTATVWLGTLVFEGLHHPLGQLSVLWSLDEDIACNATPLLLGLPHARQVGEGLPAADGHACGGRRVLASGTAMD